MTKILDRPMNFSSIKRNGNGNGLRASKHSHVITIGGNRFLIDPGSGSRSTNWRIPNLQAIIITHSHVDHFGDLPSFRAANPKAKIYCTPSTKYFIAEYLLKKNPLRRHMEVEKLLSDVLAVDFEREYRIANNVNIIFHYSGHLLGSASVSFVCPEGNILVSGDYSDQDRDVLRPFKFPNIEYRAFISEGSFIGMQEPDFFEQREALIFRAKEILESGGNLLVALDLIGMAQEFVYYLTYLMEKGEMKQYPIFCFDFEKSRFGADGFDYYAHRTMDAYPQFFKELQSGFRKVFQNRTKLRNHLTALTPSGEFFDPTCLSGAIFVMHTRYFKSEKIAGFRPADFGRRIAHHGGAIVFNHLESLSDQFYERMGLRKTDNGDKLLGALPFSHPYARSVENLIRQAGARTNILVHGRYEDMSVFADSLPQRVFVPHAGDQIDL